MDKKTLLLVSGIFFGVAGILHLLRALSSWSLIIESFSIPVWFSYLVAIILLVLSYNSFKLYKGK